MFEPLHWKILLGLLPPDFMEIYVADSESSSIRALNLKTGGSRLLAGGDPIFPDNLFKVIQYAKKPVSSQDQILLFMIQMNGICKH